MTENCDDNERLAREIVDLIGNRTLEDAQHALENAFAFYMSLACPDCRKQMAETLRENLPEMLAAADRLAAGEFRHLH